MCKIIFTHFFEVEKLMKKRTSYIIIGITIVVGIILDLVTKAYFAEYFSIHSEDIVVIPNFFIFTFLKNTGAAYGIFGDSTVMLSIVSILFVITFIFYDIFNHICEQYFSGEDDNTSDYISEGLMKSVIHSSRIANKNPEDYEARSNIMWTATWALNTLVAKGKSTDWMVHMLGQSVGACTDATHGMTLAAVSLPYYKNIMPYGIAKFVRFAKNVWNVDSTGKTDEEVALEGLAAMENWMKELGLVMNITDLGATKEMHPDLVKGTRILSGGYKALDASEIEKILLECF